MVPVSRRLHVSEPKGEVAARADMARSAKTTNIDVLTTGDS
jgi:hypothetical protein